MRQETVSTDPDALRAALSGVRGLLLDLDGVIIVAGQAVPGAPEALRELDRRAIPYRIVTNTSMVSRATLASWSSRLGAPVPAHHFHSALSVSAAWTAQHLPGQPLYVLASEDARTEFAGQHLLSHEDAARPNARAAAVVIGDSPEDATWDNLNRAFRLIRAGAELIGMHKNPWWLTPDGPTLDSGAFVAGLEFATGVRARTVGKPAAAFFGVALRDLSSDIAGRDGGRKLARRDVAMVGDDLSTDIRAAQRFGLRAVLVLTGKHGLADVERIAGGRAGAGRPGAIAPSLSEVVAALD